VVKRERLSISIYPISSGCPDNNSVDNNDSVVIHTNSTFYKRSKYIKFHQIKLVFLSAYLRLYSLLIFFVKF
jgi:hypothetical protein